MQSLVAIIVGFVATGAGVVLGTGVLARLLPADFPAPPAMVTSLRALALEQLLVAVCAVAGCWLCARLAPSQPLRHALQLGAVAFALGIPNTIVNWAHAPAWYHLLGLLLVMPYAWLGGWLRQRQVGA